MAEVKHTEAEKLVTGWQDMSTAPKNGNHCILAVQRGPFVYAIQGAFMAGKWMNAADIDADPLCWMPNVMIPDEFLPWMNSAKLSPPTREEGGRDDV